MKKIVIASAIVLTTGVLALVNRENNTKAVKAVRMAVSIDKNVTATAD